METEKLRVLLTALDCGSLSAAAEKLDYTPSGVSRAVQARNSAASRSPAKAFASASSASTASSSSWAVTMWK